jgi:non-specific serine/threonine protein kinase
LLGGFHLRYRNETVGTINTARLQSLLAYLAVHQNSPVSRQSLAFMFWPDTSETQARANLRNLLHKLRASLPDADSFLSIGQHTVQWLASPSSTLDVDQFLFFASQSTSVSELKQAILVYAGDFMPDCYEDWAQTVRENLRQTYLTSMEKLVLLLADDRNQREALEFAHILLRQEPTREETYRQLMGLYAQCGDRASVARIYNTCVTVLERELGLEPGPATRKAYENFIHQAAQLDVPVGASPVSLEERLLHNLPASLTSFIGRSQELKQINLLLSSQRLVTLCGPGGIGKTRLALAAARERIPAHRGGIVWVDLTSVRDPGMVTGAIADALQVSDQVRSAGLEGLVNLLRDQELLFLLDNCEHLTGEAGTVAIALLQACPGLRIVTTSREALNVYGETAWQVPALPVPAPDEPIELQDLATRTQTWLANESVALFIERAASTLPTFQPDPRALQTIAAICRRLEGIPLAIEMAAARVKTLTVQQIALRLDNTLELLRAPSNSALPRHRTMEAVMDWSHDMLTGRERELFARLSVFSGHFSLQAVEQICQGKGIREGEILELLASLVDKSLVGSLSITTEARFRLHEIARQYGRTKLAAQRSHRRWQNRHLDYFVHLAEEAEPNLRASSQLEWLGRLDLEQENLRAALHLALRERDTPDDRYAARAARLAGALWVYWFIRGHFSEGRRLAEQALSLLDHTEAPGPVLGKVLYTAASFALFQGDFARGEALTRQSLAVSRACGDEFGEVISYHHFGMLANAQGDPSKAGRSYRRGLRIANRVEDPWLIGVMLNGLGVAAFNSHDHENAFKYYRQELEIGRQSGDKFQVLYSLISLAELALQRGDLEQAALFTEEELAVSKAIGERRGISSALQHLGRIALRRKDNVRAGELLKQSLRGVWSTRDRASVLEHIVHLVDYEVQAGRFEVAARLLAVCDAVLQSFPAGFRLLSQDLYERLVENVQGQLDGGVFTASWTLGRLMSLEQAVSFALIDRPAGEGSSV